MMSRSWRQSSSRIINTSAHTRTHAAQLFWANDRLQQHTCLFSQAGITNFLGRCFKRSVYLMSASKAIRVGLDAFCFKQFEATHIGPRIPLSTSQFLSEINEKLLVGAEMVDGYAPFCKHVFVPAFFKCPVSAIPISDPILPLIRSK